MAIDGRSARKTLVINPGPYEALVVSLLDPKRMGAIQVELLKNSTSGNQPERSGQIVTVQYMSPFAGVTPIDGTTSQDDFQGTFIGYANLKDDGFLQQEILSYPLQFAVT